LRELEGFLLIVPLLLWFAVVLQVMIEGKKIEKGTQTSGS
jgi:hypothetical protein